MKISSKINIFVVGMVVSVSVASAFLVFRGYSAIIRSLQTEALENRATLEVERLRVAFREVEHDIQMLARLPTVTRIADSAGVNEVVFEKAKDDLAVIFEQVLESKPAYDQVRIIGLAEEGREVVRTNRLNGEVQRVPEDQLQRKGFRPYFIEATEYPGSTPYYSQVNLNWEWNRIETPYRPMLRATLPIYRSSGELFGIVIINLNFRSFIDSLFDDQGVRYRYYLTNSEGYYLFHPDPAETFGFDIGEDTTAQREFPELDGFFSSGDSDITFRKEGLVESSAGLVHFQKCAPIGDREFAFGIAASFDDIAEASTRIGRDTVILIVLCIGGSILLAFWFSGRITRPLRRITKATDRFAEGMPAETLLVRRDDEIGTLASSFIRMRKAIKDHEEDLREKNRELRSLNEDLRHFNHISSHELREPIRRISALARLFDLESSSSGDPAEREKLLRQMQAESDRALKQIEDFRVFSQISEGSLKRERVDLDRLTDEVLSEFRDEMSRRAVEIQKPKLPQISGYPTLLHTLYRNLVENALTHSKSSPLLIEFLIDDVKDPNRFGLKNTGPRLPVSHEQSSKIFDPFTKMESEASGGSGMGLAICKRIVECHGGEIWAVADENHFRIEFSIGRSLK